VLFVWTAQGSDTVRNSSWAVSLLPPSDVKCAYDLIVPCLVDRREMFGRLLNKRNQDQAHKVVRDAPCDNMLYLLYQKDRDQCDEANRQYERAYALSKGEFCLCKVILMILVELFIGLEGFGEYAFVAGCIVEDVDEESNHQDNGCRLTDLPGVEAQLVLCEAFMISSDGTSFQGSEKCAGDKETEASNKQQARGCFADRWMKLLLGSLQAANEEAHTQTQKNVCEDRPENSSLNDWY